jgi:PsbP
MTIGRLFRIPPGHAWLRTSAAASLVWALAACSAGGSSSGSAASAPVSTAAGGTSSAPRSATATASGQAGSPVKPVPVESNPPGDIPDSVAFVPYTNRAGGYTFRYPEGWLRKVTGPTVRFTDKLNGVTVTSMTASGVPTVASARSTDVPELRSSVPAFELRGISAVALPAGKAVRIVFRRNSDPDQVTGRVYRDEAEEYSVVSHGRLVRMDLFGPVGADNVDAYRTMSTSLQIR